MLYFVYLRVGSGSLRLLSPTREDLRLRFEETKISTSESDFAKHGKVFGRRQQTVESIKLPCFTAVQHRSSKAERQKGNGQRSEQPQGVNSTNPERLFE